MKVILKVEKNHNYQQTYFNIDGIRTRETDLHYVTNTEGSFIPWIESYHYIKSILILMGFKPMISCLALGK